jgi:hypothetical protein
MTMSEMTVASAANSEYFLPFKQGKNFYISGDNIASSPAYLAYMNAIQLRNKTQSELRIVSVGSVMEQPDPFTDNLGLIAWAARISGLNAPVK